MRSRPGWPWSARCQPPPVSEHRSVIRAFPDISVGLGQAYMRQHAADELLRHLGCVHGPVVEGGNHRKDNRAGVCGQTHVAQMDLVEGRLTNAEDERAAL